MDSAAGDDIYTSLRALVRLRYSARGFSYLPRQPVRSLLSGRKRSPLPPASTMVKILAIDGPIVAGRRMNRKDAE